MTTLIIVFVSVAVWPRRVNPGRSKATWITEGTAKSNVRHNVKNTLTVIRQSTELARRQAYKLRGFIFLSIAVWPRLANPSIEGRRWGRGATKAAAGKNTLDVFDAYGPRAGVQPPSPATTRLPDMVPAPTRPWRCQLVLETCDVLFAPAFGKHHLARTVHPKCRRPNERHMLATALHEHVCFVWGILTNRPQTVLWRGEFLQTVQSIERNCYLLITHSFLWIVRFVRISQGKQRLLDGLYAFPMLGALTDVLEDAASQQVL